MYFMVVFCFCFKQKTAYDMRISTGVQTCALPIWLHPNIGNQALEITQRFTFPHRADRDILHGPPKIMLGCFVEGSNGLGEQRDRLADLKDVTMPHEIGRASCRGRGCQYV